MQLFVRRCHSFEQKRHHATFVHCYAIKRVLGQVKQRHGRRAMHVRIFSGHVAHQGSYSAQSAKQIILCIVNVFI